MRCRIVLFEHQDEVGYASRGLELIVVVDLWLMPLECLHMTALEITHSQTEQEIDLLVQKLGPMIPTVSFIRSMTLMDKSSGFRSSPNDTTNHWHSQVSPPWRKL